MTNTRKYPITDEFGRPRTPWAIRCHPNQPSRLGCGLVYLTEQEYDSQMSCPDDRWRCPVCGTSPADWDDDNYEQFMEEEEVN